VQTSCRSAESAIGRAKRSSTGLAKFLLNSNVHTIQNGRKSMGTMCKNKKGRHRSSPKCQHFSRFSRVLLRRKVQQLKAIEHPLEMCATDHAWLGFAGASIVHWFYPPICSTERCNTSELLNAQWT